MARFLWLRAKRAKRGELGSLRSESEGALVQEHEQGDHTTRRYYWSNNTNKQLVLLITVIIDTVLGAYQNPTGMRVLSLQMSTNFGDRS
jgi:hypothetical protein